VEKGIEPQIELLRARQRAGAARGDYQIAKLSADRAAGGVEEAQFEIEALKQRFRAQVVEELAAAKAELASIMEELPALQDRVVRTDVRAPIDGVVNQVLVTTVGGVVQPGQPIVELVPRDDSLLVEAYVNPADIAFLRPGQKAQVKLTAYDYNIYGALDGRLEHISADAIQNEDGVSLYRINVRTDTNVLKGEDGEDLPIIPGMIAEVDILNGKRTVLDYLLSPLNKVREKALRES